MTSTRTSLIVIALGCAMALPARADSFRGDYSVSLWGLTIGRSTFRTSIEGDRVTVDGTASSAGLAKVFDSTKATLSVSARVGASSVTPTRYRVSYSSGKRSRSKAIDFRGGAVTRTEIKPPPIKKDGNWIALDTGDLRRVADPLSAAFIKADSLDDVCRQTLRVYDGASRMDLKLAHAGREPVSIEGYEGEAVTCSAAFVPRSGYRPTDRSVIHMRKSGNIRIAFAPLGETGVYAPVRATVDTELGTVTLSAERYGPE